MKSLEVRAAISARMIAHNPMSVPAFREKMRKAKMGCIPWNKGIRGYTTSWRGGHHTEEGRKHLRESHWSKRYPEKFERIVIRGSLLKVGRHPNIFEEKCERLLNELYRGEFEYCGQGSVLINKKSPDFKSRLRKVVVLCNGLWWHLGKFGIRDTAKNRRKVENREAGPFKKDGYNVWFIWEDEVDARTIVMG